MKRTQRWISLVLSMALVLSAMPVIAVGEHNVLLPDTKFNEPFDAIEEDIALEVGSTDDGLRDTNDSKESISLMDDTSSVRYEVDGGTLYFNTATGTITYFSVPVSSGSNPSFEISIPSEIEGVAVTAIGEGAFKSNRLLSITLPDSVTTIGEAAFESCYRLLDIKLPESLTTIDNYAFKDCDALTEISLGKNITSLGSYIFSGCDKLSNVNLENATISEGMFSNCTSLTNVAVSNNITEICNYAFGRCNNLSSVTIPAAAIGKMAFYDCDKLSSVTLGENVPIIGEDAFQDCDSLTTIKIPNSVSEIGSYAFNKCNNLEKVFIGSGVTTIGLNAFYECSNLQSFSVDPQNPSFSNDKYGVLLDKYNMIVQYPIGNPMNTYTIPVNMTETIDGIIYLGYYSHAFHGCTNLQAFSVPEGNLSFCVDDVGVLLRTYYKEGDDVNDNKYLSLYRYPIGNKNKSYSVPDYISSIESEAFYGCDNLHTITFPTTLVEIDNDAFYDCDNLDNIIIPAEVTDILSCAFNECDSLSNVFFMGDAPNVEARNYFRGSFPETVTLYYIEGTSGWTDSDAYDADAGTWNGYRIRKWDSGSCGQSLTWSLRENGTLYISGTGEMYDYDILSVLFPGSNLAPWLKYNQQIKEVVIEEGVTSIGSYAFQHMPQLARVYVSDSLTQIGESAFYKSHNLRALYFSGEAPVVIGTTLNDYLTDVHVYYQRGNTSWPESWFGLPTSPYYATFQYYSELSSKEIVWQCDYDDNWFSQSAYTYNHDLSKTSLCLTNTSHNAPGAKQDYTTADRNIKALLESFGFENYDVLGYHNQPTADSVAAAFASKKITDETGNYTLVAVAARSGAYEREWASNFTVGQEEYHEGFVSSAHLVEDKLNKYLNSFNITGPVKFWVTGYSRGSAVANIIAIDLDDYTSRITADVTWSCDDVFAYCFEVPRSWGTQEYLQDSSIYENIFVIVNNADFVTKVAPVGYGFHTVGTILQIPTGLTAEPMDMLQTIARRGNKSEVKYTLVPNQGFYYDDLLDTLTTLIVPSVDDYVQDLQPFVRELFIAAGGLEGVGDIFPAIFKDIKKAINATGFASAIVSDISDNKLKYLVSPSIASSSAALDYLHNSIYQSIQNNIPGLTDEEIDTLATNLAKVVLGTIIRIIQNEYDLWNIAASLWGPQSWLASISADVIKTVSDVYDKAAYSFGGFAMAHYPDLCLAWMESVTGIYNLLPDDMEYSLYFFNCPVDISVVDSSGTVVAAIENDISITDPNSPVSSFIDADGQKVFVLPKTGNYTFKITATEDGSFSTAGYFYDGNGLSRIVDYRDIEITKNDELLAIASIQENAAASNYALQHNNSDIACSADLTGDEINTYTVSVNSEGHGSALGGSIYTVGSFAQVTATPDAGEEFLGWFDAQDNLLSNSLIYRFAVTDNHTITAKFTELQPEITLTGIHAALQEDGIRIRFQVTNHTTSGTAKLQITLRQDELVVYSDEVSTTLFHGESYFDVPYTDSADICEITLVDDETGEALTTSVTMEIEVFEVDAIQLSQSSINCTVGETYCLSADILPKDTYSTNITWTSSDDSVAEVSDGIVTITGAGEAIITAAIDSCEAECIITSSAEMNGLILNQSSIFLKMGDAATISVSADPYYLETPEVSWFSTAEAVATVSSSGVIQAIDTGTCSIIAITDDGKYVAVCDVEVGIASVSVETSSTITQSGFSVMLSGSCAVPYDCDVYRAGFRYGTSPDSMNSSFSGELTDLGNGIYVFSAEGSFLPNTTYYAEAYIRYEDSTGETWREYGNMISFTTSAVSAPPTISLNEEIEVSPVEGGQYAYVLFTPDITSCYTAQCSDDNTLSFLNQDFQSIYGLGEYSDNQYKETTYLKAGETYYIRAQCADSSSISVTYADLDELSSNPLPLNGYYIEELFRFTSPAAYLYTLQITSCTDAYIEIYDENGLVYWDSAESDTVFDATFQFELAGAKTYFIFIESDHESRSGNYISMTATEPVLDPMLTTSFNVDSGLATITFTALADGQCLIARYNVAGQMQDCIACEARKGEATSISMSDCSIGDKIALFHVDQQYAPVCPSFDVMISQ